MQKKDCPISRAFTDKQKQQLATSTYRAWKEKEHSKKTSSVNPTLVHPVDCKLLRRVEGNRVIEETPASKKKKSSEDIPKASKKKSSKPVSDDL